MVVLSFEIFIITKNLRISIDKKSKMQKNLPKLWQNFSTVFEQ